MNFIKLLKRFCKQNRENNLIINFFFILLSHKLNNQNINVKKADTNFRKKKDSENYKHIHL